MKHHHRLDLVALPLLAFILAAPKATQAEDSSPTDPKHLAFFEKKIRPVLVEHCYECHASTAKKVRGGLLLDSRSGWQAGGDSGPALVPGKPDESLILRALRYETFEMPPSAKLPESVVDDFVHWIKLGAPDPRTQKVTPPKPSDALDLESRKQWWSFRSRRDVAPPRVDDATWPLDEVDHFTLAALEERGWTPAKAAAPLSWLRRVAYDLTGLPPDERDVLSFMEEATTSADGSAPPSQAYERIVDRLLESPQFGEQWARHWMDLVRYGESKAFEADYLMPNVFRYRDYLIRAFNANVPYDQFVREAIAGDLLEKPRLNPETGENESVIGSGYLYLTDGQHGPPDLHADEARIFEGMIDVVGKTFLGLTVACARCHDHKFDAIATQDYYSLYGIIASSRLNYADINPPAAQDEAAKELGRLKEPVREALADLLVKDFQSARQDLEAVTAGRAETDTQKRWAKALGGIRKKGPNGELHALASLLAAKDHDQIRSAWTSLRKDSSRSRDWLGNPQPSRTSFADWIPSGRAFGSAPHVPGEFVVTPSDDRVVASFTGGYAGAGTLTSRFAGALRSPSFDVGESVSVRVKGKNVRVSLIIRHYELVGHGPTTGGLTKVINSDNWQTVRFNTRLWVGLRGYLEIIQNGGEFHFKASTGKHVDGAYAVLGSASNAGDPPRPTPALAFVDPKSKAPATRDAVLDRVAATLQGLPEKWRSGTLTASESDLLDALREAGVLNFSAGRSEALKAAVEAFRARQGMIPPPTYVRSLADGIGEDEPIYIRGSHTNLSKKRSPRSFLVALDPQPFRGRGSGRREWAEALLNEDNPLTARVMVNRVWHHLFGRGLVASVDDFGYMGDKPSHPELLDYLASDFIADGWSIKRLIRRLVLSRTYRMSTQASTESRKQDPDNVYLQHMPVRRLQAEAIRDTLLTLGGRLKPQLFGPSVNEKAVERRSVYVQLRRRAMPPFLMLFDMPDATETFGRRNLTSSPTQSLEFLNGEIAWTTADDWARRIVTGPDKTFEQRIDRMHRQAFSRPATRREIEWARAIVTDRAIAKNQGDATADTNDHDTWRVLSHTMLNRKELLYVY